MQDGVVGGREVEDVGRPHHHRHRAGHQRLPELLCHVLWLAAVFKRQGELVAGEGVLLGKVKGRWLGEMGGKEEQEESGEVSGKEGFGSRAT